LIQYEELRTKANKIKNEAKFYAA